MFRWICGFVLVCALLAQPVWAADPPQYFDDQPTDEYSTLGTFVLNATTDLPAVHDYELASWVKSLLMPAGTSNCRDAKFLFQTCYSGGMLDDINDAFGTTVKWVGGAAARHNELSWGQLSTIENSQLPVLNQLSGIFVADPPQNFWTEALHPELNKDQAMIAAINNARRYDRCGRRGAGGVSQGHFEHPQSIYANGGETIKLADSQASHHHAIIFVGDPAGQMRHFYDADNIRNALIAQWGQPNGTTITIDMLFWNGTQKPDLTLLPTAWGSPPAKSARYVDLQNAISALAMGTGEEFFFYAGDHGGHELFLTGPGPMGPGGVHHGHLTETVGALEGMWLEPDNAPTFTARHQGVAGPNASVWFNGHLLGYLDPGAPQTIFPVDENIVNLENEFEVHNDNPAPMVLEGVALYTGSIGPNPALLSSAKTADDGEPVKVSRAVVTAVFSGYFYMQNADRPCGIRVQGTGLSVMRGDMVDVLGTINTNEYGERYIACERILVVESGCEVTPLAMPGRSIGGGNWFYNPSTGAGQMGVYGAYGLNNIGLLVRTCGRVVFRDEPAGWFVIRDGSYPDVPGWFPGVMVFVPPGGYVSPVGAFRTVTGISSRYGTYEVGYRRILALPEPM